MPTRHPLLRLPFTENHRHLPHQWCDERRTWTTKWNDSVFIDESRFCLQHHDGQIRVWRHRGERPLNCCIMHRHTVPAPGLMDWGGIVFHCRAPLVLLVGTLIGQRYISVVLETVVLPYIQCLPLAIFQQDNAHNTQCSRVLFYPSY
ncbi:transposable element Tcb1 transposase [Trichonephila clavipes]|nr:transposable element Tcb1 transposase [Trichonephila clavipes]